MRNKEMGDGNRNKNSVIKVSRDRVNTRIDVAEKQINKSKDQKILQKRRDKEHKIRNKYNKETKSRYASIVAAISKSTGKMSG